MALITKSRFLVSDKKPAGRAEVCEAGAGSGTGSISRPLPRRQRPRRARSSRRGDDGLQRSDSFESAGGGGADAARAFESAEGRSNAALDLAKSAVRNAPNSPEARLALIRTLMAKREFAQADAMLKPIEKAFPNVVPGADVARHD